MNTVSIGFHREDGDFQLLATLNNNDRILSDESFESLIDLVRDTLAVEIGEAVEYLVRQDAPDYITTEEQA
jgi:hypothetical protein